MIIHSLRLNFHRLGELCGEHRLKMPLSGSFLTKVLVLEGALSPVLLALVQRDNELVGLSSDDLRLPKSPPIQDFSLEKTGVIKVPSSRSLGPFNQSGNGERAA